MRNPMNRRLTRELRGDIGKYLVIFLFIVMVISVVSSFLVSNAEVELKYYESMDVNFVEDGHVSFNTVPDEEMLKKIEGDIGVTFYRADYFEEDNDGATIKVYSLDGEVNIPEVTQGRLPVEADEIALDNVHAVIAGIEEGDVITLGDTALKVTGFMAVPNYSALFRDNGDLMFDSENFGLGVMTKEGFENFESNGRTVNYAWKYNTAPESDKDKSEASEKLLSTLRDEIIAYDTDIMMRSVQSELRSDITKSAMDEENIPDIVEFTSDNETSPNNAENLMNGESGSELLEITDYLPAYENKAINFAGEDMTGDKAAISVFLYIVVAVLAFIVAVTAVNTLTKESAVIGTLRAMGYTRGELVRHYILLPFLSFLTGMVVGNLLGYTVMREFMLGIYRSMYSFGITSATWNTPAFIKTTLIPGLIMLSINSVILIWKMRISPLSFLRKELSESKRRHAVRLSKGIPFKWRFRMRIILQNMSNYLIMAVGIIMAGAIIIFGLMFKPLLDTVAQRTEDTAICEYQYFLRQPVMIDKEGAEKFAGTSLETSVSGFKTDEVTVYGIIDESRFIKKDIPEGAVLISNGFMEKYGLGVGDKIELYDRYTDKDYEMTVAGKYDYEASLAVFMNLDEFNSMFDKAEDYYTGYFSDENIDDALGENIYMVIGKDDLGKTASQLWDSFAKMMGPVKWFGVIMFVLMVYLLSKQIIEKNQTSISMTKILGFGSAEIGSLYIVTTSIVAVLSLLIAVPLVDRLLKLIFKYYLYQRMSGYLPYNVSMDCYIKMIVLGVVSYLAVVILQLLKIRRIPKSDALKTVE
ncbi:MAG: ABC transporter permease [Lachnospiraceae bacterium]|nr:ABC transporter permease [Lachnospiraceae bacterium]